MAERSNIEWTDASWTPIRARYLQIQNDGSGKERIGWHCEHVSPGCKFCYSEALNRRLGTGRDFAPDEMFVEAKRGYRNGRVKPFLDATMLQAPVRWRRPRRIFVCSMTDLFADFVPVEWIAEMFNVIAECPQHTFQILTKRAKRMQSIMSGAKSHDLWHPKLWHNSVLPNVWMGVSVEDQPRAEERIPYLMATPAAVRFLSAEPLLGPIDLRKIKAPTDGAPIPNRCGRYATRIDLVIVGGESGPHKRPMDLEWARDLRAQCADAGISYFFKQVDKVQPIPADLMVREFPDARA